MKRLTITDFEPSHRNPMVAMILYLLDILRKSYDESGISYGIRRSGSRHPYSVPPLSLWGEVSFEEWLETDLDWDETITVPKWNRDQEFHDDAYPGLQFECRASKRLSFMRKLGYVDSELLFEDISPSTSGGYLKEYLSLSYPYSYLYTVLRPFPSFFPNLPSGLNDYE